MNKKQISHWLSVIVIGITLGFALQFVRAWTEPTQAPPGGNVGAPINTSANPQTKSGGFNVMGSLGIGTESPANKLDVAGKVKATGDICTTVTGSEICLSTVSGTPVDPVDVDPGESPCQCVAGPIYPCGSGYTSECIGGGNGVPGNYWHYTCTASGWETTPGDLCGAW